MKGSKFKWLCIIGFSLLLVLFTNGNKINTVYAEDETPTRIATFYTDNGGGGIINSEKDSIEIDTVGDGYATLPSGYISAGDMNFTITVRFPNATEKTINIKDGRNITNLTSWAPVVVYGGSGYGVYAGGETVTLKLDDYDTSVLTFTEWKVEEGDVTLEDSTATTTTFVVPDSTKGG